MKTPSIKHLGLLAIGFTLTAGSLRADNGHAGGNSPGAVYTIDNAASGNHVLVYNRAANGTLTSAGSVATGGMGTGQYLGSQGALVLSRDGNYLYVCNAGSSDVSVFQVTSHGLKLTDKVSSNGKNPISLALHQNQLFVLNAGGQVGDQDNVTGFLAFGGKLLSLPNSTHALSAANTAPAQVGFTPDGAVLVVTEKMTSILDTFTLTSSGAIATAQQFPSSGMTPYGFDFHGNILVVSEAFMDAPNGSAMSSYQVKRDGTLTVVSASSPTHQTAACWVVITDNGPFAYDSNTPSDTISGYLIDCDGDLTLLNSDGITANSGNGTLPFDMALTQNQKYLYSLNLGTGTIGGFAIGQDGSLTAVPNTTSGIPSGATGLVAR
jgi:6-phosphogluconolactonase